MPQEPICLYLGGVETHCFWSKGNKPEFPSEIEVGDFTVSAESYAEFKKYVNDLNAQNKYLRDLIKENRAKARCDF